MERKFSTPRVVGKVENINQAVDFFNNLPRSSDTFTIFRGHSDADWKAIPSLFRTDPDISGFEHKMVRELISKYPAEFSSDESMFDRLVRMQHFGLPTRLLDMTKNPLVALFFAVEDEDYHDVDGGVVLTVGPLKDREKYFDSDAVSCIANLSNLTEEEREVIEETTADTIAEFNKLNPVDRLYQFIRIEKPHFRKAIKKIDLFKPYYVIAKMNNRRVIAQSGVFIIHGLSRNNAPKYKRNVSNSQIVIPASNKSDIKKSLQKLGYDGSILFPEIDRAAKQIAQHFSDMANPS